MHVATPLIGDLAIVALCLVAIAGILVRPFGVAEWVWAFGAACIVAVARLLPVSAIVQAVAAGTDVYLFLAGMMLLAEIARYNGVFDWVATLAVGACDGSPRKLFALVYVVGIGVTIVLSNDATAVVLTPAVAAAVRAAKAEPLPYLFACALIANAASFVLPISNPANLVVFAGEMPRLPVWFAAFAIPSLCSIVITFVLLTFIFRRELRGTVEVEASIVDVLAGGRIALTGIGATALALLVASAFGAHLGLVTFVAGLLLFALSSLMNRRAALPVLRSISWSVLPLVAGLFVLAAAVEEIGLLHWTRLAASTASQWPAPYAVGAMALGTGLAANVINNLPAGLIAGTTLTHAHVAPALRNAVAIGIDLGPNLSVTGSLATLLWLIVLRRENIDVDPWHFLRVGLVAMPIALIAAAESVLIGGR